MEDSLWSLRMEGGSCQAREGTEAAEQPLLGWGGGVLVQRNDQKLER